MHSDSLRAQPKQKRGQRRVDAILNAASERFAEVGYENATIIEIAARADTSVGSLYQFFANKEAILKALVERYVERASVVFAGMEVEAFPEMTLEQSIKAILVPLKAFIRDNRDFQVIFSSPTGSTYVDETIRSMDEAFLARTGASLLRARPNMRAEDLRKYSLVCMVIMKGLLGLAHHSSELTLDEVFEELEAVYLRYLTPLMGG
ncbi:MAG: TetR/AcrR family transcriptional regulator [Chloroflexi bacterium]|nr:TetR/AcrR family transcriptional regulator [Chloroflexota bacterium]